MSRLVTGLLRGLIQVYRYCLAPLLPGHCRYLPTCSQYGLEALQLHGPLRGGWLTLRRLSRCQPWGGHGHDPVPRSGPHQPRRRPDPLHSTADGPPPDRRPAPRIEKATPHV